jgi:hypothetical protein
MSDFSWSPPSVKLCPFTTAISLQERGRKVKGKIREKAGNFASFSDFFCGVKPGERKTNVR